jgi:hypothetical protein
MTSSAEQATEPPIRRRNDVIFFVECKLSLTIMADPDVFTNGLNMPLLSAS